ncbi:hypothetical protein [Sphingobacterium yanglingense]|uniref:Uncharacterized protein n=1 Tax=Sphingobacterium yanglingense TaxID=1437280 RepID=A0A4V3DCY1_9SPHI|nr:hypothetical protein [Sphingobacterium yanglingense]TDQ73933.1 hypothetical protein CLV99_4371 [Sphingobacterium yanglingense]
MKAISNIVKLLIINFSILGSYTLAQSNFSDSKAVDPSILPYRHISSKHITEHSASRSRTDIASKLKSFGAGVHTLFEENKNAIPLVGTFYEFYTLNNEKALVTIRKVPPGFEEDELDENKVVRANNFAELVEYYHGMFDPDYTAVIKYVNTDSVQSAFFISTLSSSTHIEYMFLISDPTFSKEVFRGTVYFKRSSPSDNKEANMREFLESIQYGTVSPTHRSQGKKL